MPNKQTIKKIYLSAWIFEICLLFVIPAWANNGFIFNPRGYAPSQDYPICRELLKIVNLPENKEAIGKRAKVKEIIIPEKYKNFEKVKWQPISLEEAKKLTPDGYLEKVMAADKSYAINIAKDWDGKGEFIFEKAIIDYDYEPPVETMLRYRIPAHGAWNCLFSKETPNPFRDYFNPTEDRGSYSSGGENCELIYYGKRIYLINKSLEKYVYVFKPVRIRKTKYEEWNVLENQICEIVDTK